MTTVLTPHSQCLEKIPVSIFSSANEACEDVARQIQDLIKSKATRGERAVLGLATGSTPIMIYEELVRMHREAGLSFANVTTFNLDEYWPMGATESQSYRRFMQEYLFDHVDIDPDHVNIPDGEVPADRAAEYCREYEARIQDCGGIDFQILGIGRTGHIGFNEPGSSRESRTRLITLDKATRMDAASDFFGEWNVPHKAITMGVGTILGAKKIVLLAFGEHKAAIIKRAVEGDISASVAASFLQEHADTGIVLDSSASAELTRCKTPWRLGPVEQLGFEWNDTLVRRAVIWLANEVDKPILKLTAEDYNENELQDLISARGSAYEINIEIFKRIQKTITGWPGGKPDQPVRYVPGVGLDPEGRPEVYPKRIVVFSPHPDDDVISMGGTLIRLCDHGHEVHVAYQTSGNIAVFDECARRHLDFAMGFCEAFASSEMTEHAHSVANGIDDFLERKKDGNVDSPDLQAVKTLIRRVEARSAATYSGVSDANIHFLDMPFYETGQIRKRPLGEDDVQIIVDLLDELKPHQIYAAGDLTDPHGTHRVCLEGITKAVQRLHDRAWMEDCVLWLYRGAWQEWEPHHIEMAVPLAPDEVERKRTAIFEHESQKDRALFPGSWDTREFWQRAEERNRKTAELYDQLGLPEYEAIEAFVRWKS
ncbi:MAG: glucosamine-6-phosphate deaminase [Planctomycetota bacterium]|nr:glucosamine-6-phosphate deaminase [Planctomycetota bacterium]